MALLHGLEHRQQMEQPRPKILCASRDSRARGSAALSHPYLTPAVCSCAGWGGTGTRAPSRAGHLPRSAPLSPPPVFWSFVLLNTSFSSSSPCQCALYSRCSSHIHMPSSPCASTRRRRDLMHSGWPYRLLSPKHRMRGCSSICSKSLPTLPPCTHARARTTR